MPVNGDLTKVLVSSDDGVSYEPICVFGNQMIVDFGTRAINEESCLSQEDPITSTGDLTYAEQELSYLWSEGAGDAANVIIQTAALADILEDKTIDVQVEANNSLGVSGTLYDFQAIVTAYSHTFIKGEVNKTLFTLKQTTVPVETPAEATP